MGYALWIILGYLLLLTGLNFWRSRRVKTQEEFMVAGRKLSLTVIVFTLICTWIGSGTFIAGAEYAALAGWSSLWMPAGAWIGILLIYFLAGKIRTFGQYTIGDILEVRYGKFARVFGAVCLVIAFTTIVAYQFRAGGYILEVATDGAISVELGQVIAAAFVILFTALGGMVAVAHTDLPNGIIIVLACVGALPFALLGAGGWESAHTALPASHTQLFASDFGEYPALKAAGYFLSTLLLLMGIQTMYQKFYAAKSPREARRGVAIWIVGTIVIETVVVAIAVFAASKHWLEIREYGVVTQAQQAVRAGQVPPGGLQKKLDELVAGEVKEGRLDADRVPLLRERLGKDLADHLRSQESFLEARVGLDPRAVVLQAARDTASRGGIGLIFGLLLLAAACAVVISTGMNYLLSPSTNLIRDILGRGRGGGEDEGRTMVLQKVLVVALGLCAFAMIFVPTVLKSDISVLKYSYFAYTIYGVAITPALFAALTWKRATPAGGIASIVVGAAVTLFLEVLLPQVAPQVMRGDDPWGIPTIFPAFAASLLSLVIGSYATRPPERARLERLFPGEGAAAGP
jgi:SSS family solute:Na+ symporter/sodium/proline symporter